jgi:hypothetical protein
VEGVLVEVLDARERPHPRRVDQGVDAAEPLRRLVDRGLARLRIGDVTLDRERAVAGLLRRIDEPLVATLQQGDAGSVSGEPDPDAPAEPARGSDDDNSNDSPPGPWLFNIDVDVIEIGS